jgi:hypothetical protein
MQHSLNQYADQVLNGVYAGLKGPANFPISKEQVKDEIAQERNARLEKRLKQGYADIESYRQTIPKLQVVRKDFSGITDHITGRQELWAQIPELPNFTGVKPVAWVSAMDKVIPFKIVYGNDFAYAQHDKFSASKPTIWITDTNLWLFNPPIATIKFITIRTLVENPRALNGVGGIKFTDDDPYPMPLAMGTEIRNKLVNDYINQYRRGTMQPTLMAGDLNISTGNA